jgi:hypothetical protein
LAAHARRSATAHSSAHSCAGSNAGAGKIGRACTVEIWVVSVGRCCIAAARSPFRILIATSFRSAALLSASVAANSLWAILSRPHFSGAGWIETIAPASWPASRPASETASTTWSAAGRAKPAIAAAATKSHPATTLKLGDLHIHIPGKTGIHRAAGG